MPGLASYFEPAVPARPVVFFCLVCVLGVAAWVLSAAPVMAQPTSSVRATD